MKAFKISCLLFVASLCLFSCDEREFDMPPVGPPAFNGKANISIKDFIAKYNSDLIEIPSTSTDTIGGYIVANDISGNIYKQIQIQDETGGLCIAIDRNNIFNDYRIGQQIFIDCKSLYMGKYGGYPQLGNRYSRNNDGNYTIGQMSWDTVQDHFFLNGYPDETKVKSDTITIDQMNADKIGKLVTIYDVYFEKGGEEPFAVHGTGGAIQTQSKMLVSATDANKKLTARNSSAANFAFRTMPKGVGSVTGVLSIYNGTYQITFRDSLDCAYARFGSYAGNGTKTMPWDIDYALNHQDENKQGWIQGYIVGTVAPGVNADNLIDNNNDLIFSGTFMNNTVVLAASADIKDWTKCVVVNLPSGSDLRNQVNLVDHADNLGKLLKVTGTLQKYFGAAGQNVTTGNSDEFVFEGSSSDGNGTKNNPYSVAQGISNQGAADTVWVKGFIVGCVKNGVTSVTSATDVSFTAPFNSATNVLIADNASETDYSKCIAVNLPSGTPHRSEVNLMDNPGNLGKTLNTRGKLRAYFGIPGSRDSRGTTDFFVLEGGGPGPDPGTTILNVPFDTDMGGFTTVSVKGTQVWNVNTANKYIVMSGFENNASHENEDWLISPAMNLTGKTSATLTFSHTINKGDLANLTANHTLWVSTNYTSGDPSTATWTQVTIATYPAGDSWTFVDSGNIAFPSTVLNNNNVHFAFKYLCSNAESASWEIRNVVVK